MKHYIPASFSQGPVTSLQSMLRAIAFVEQQFPVISATGLFDEDTLEAVLRFQKQNYLPVTGIVDEETWDSIASAFINAYRQLPPVSVPPYTLDNPRDAQRAVQRAGWNHSCCFYRKPGPNHRTKSVPDTAQRRSSGERGSRPSDLGSPSSFVPYISSSAAGALH